MSSVVLRGIEKSFGATRVVRSLDLEVQSGELLVLVGPSGCGKSTTLRMVAGLEEPTSGSIHIDGRDVTRVPPKDRDIGMVFQSYALYPHMSVEENIGFGLLLRGVPTDERRRQVRLVAASLALETLLERKPAQLSGGQRQRVAMGRALVREPKVLLLDEPLSNLDAALRGQMRTELQQLHARVKSTMIHVTHDQVEAMTLADRIALLHEGTLQQLGPPLELFQRPANRFVARFLGSPPMNVLDGVVTAHGEWRSGELAVPLPRPFAEGTRLALGFRAQSVRLDSAGPMRGRVTGVERLGWETLALLDSGAVVQGPTGVQLGDLLAWSVPADATYLFDDSGQRVWPE